MAKNADIILGMRSAKHVHPKITSWSVYDDSSDVVTCIITGEQHKSSKTDVVLEEW